MTSTKKEPDKYIVTFRFVGDLVDPNNISTLLEMNPSQTHKKGDVVPSHPDHIFHTGLWDLESPLAAGSTLDQHLEHMLNLLEPRASQISDLITGGCSPDFFCGIFMGQGQFNSYIELEPSILQRIANIGISLTLDIYSP